MALVKAGLKADIKSGLQSIIDKGKDVTLDDVKKVWTDAYKTYALAAVPVGGLPAAKFAGASGAGDSLSGGMGAFVADLASGLKSFWTGGAWTPDALFSYVTASADGFASPTMALKLDDLDKAADGIATDLHTYTTTKVMVTATNLISGATSTVLVS